MAQGRTRLAPIPGRRGAVLALGLVATVGAPSFTRRPTPRFEPPVLVGVGRNGAGFQGFPLTGPLNATLIIGTLGLAHQANSSVVVSRDSGRSFQAASAEAAAFLAANRTDSSKWVPAGSAPGVYHDLGSLGAEGRGKQTGATRLESPFVNTLTTTAGGGFTLQRRPTSELSVSWPIPWGAPQYPEGGAIVFPMSQTPVKLRSGGLAQAWVALVNGKCTFSRLSRTSYMYKVWRHSGLHLREHQPAVECDAQDPLRHFPCGRGRPRPPVELPRNHRQRLSAASVARRWACTFPFCTD